MKKPAIILFTLLLITVALFSSSVNANPGIPTNIPPIVSVSEMNYNATVSNKNDQPWASIDVEYATYTIHGYGEYYYARKEYNSPTDPEPNIKYTVTTDKLEADYPIPLNTTNIKVAVNGEEKNWENKKGIYHLYDVNMPRITWTIQPVPKNFSVNLHYEHPLTRTNEGYLLFVPLGQRYGSTESPFYPLYDWFAYESPKGSVKIISDRDYQTTAYLVNSTGSLRLINNTNPYDKNTLSLDISATKDLRFPYGMVIAMEDGLQSVNEFTGSIWIFASAFLLLIIAFGIVYFRKTGLRKNLDYSSSKAPV